MVPRTDVIRSSKLVFVDSCKPGINRKGKPGHFYYTDQNGIRITDEETLLRIKSLVLPPAWENVWISLKKNGYLQATGIDAAGRKQYRYHNDWTAKRSTHKYLNLLEFGLALPKARKQIARDLRRKELDERKVLAICANVLQHTLIRVGNESYKRLNGSYGLCTLRDKHFKEEKDRSAALTFSGKKGVKQHVEITDKRLLRLIKKCKDIPGQELFQYYTFAGEHRCIDSGHLNGYIREITGCDFTAKDFRTWGGTLEAFRQLAAISKMEPEKAKNKVIVETLNRVASKLGNTRAVCKASYVDPALLEAFENGKLKKYLQKVGDTAPKGELEGDEQLLLQFLRHTNK